MLFWIVVAALTAVVAAVLLYPLIRTGKAAEEDRAGEAAVYRDQLRELDRDLGAGQISPQEAEYARAEIGRRLLAVSGQSSTARRTGNRRYPFSEAFVVLILPAVGLCLYLLLGSPELPSQPLEARLENPGNDMAILVAKAERHLAENPDDGQGWDVLAPIYYKTMRIADAQTAYRNAIRLLGPNPTRLDGLAETLIALASGTLTDEARQVLQQSLALEPKNPRAEFYLALGLEQAGRKQEALAAFRTLVQQSPADAPWVPLVREHVARLGGDAAVADKGGSQLGNPTGEDVAAAETMSDGDRRQMIRGMVESLDAKLSQDPANFEGWMRLVRSYAVLNDREKAAGALRRGLAAFPADGAQGQQLLALAQELGLPTGEVRQ